MYRIKYICIGIFIGVIVTLYFFLEELLGKINMNTIRKLWKLLNQDI